MRRLVLMLCIVLITPLAAAAQQAERITVPGLLPDLPFSSAVKLNGIIYLSGMIGVVPGTLELVEGGVEAETRQALDLIGRILDYSGSSMDRIIKCTIFLVDISDYAPMNRVYASYFQEPYPARSTVAGSGLALGARVEIECMAEA